MSVMVVKNYKDLIAWQKAMDIVEFVYNATNNFPNEEKYVLTSQIRRSAISIPSNIAEGSSRSSTKEFIRFLDIAKDSLKELETQMLIAERLKLIDKNEIKNLLEKTEEVGRIMYYLKISLLKKLEAA